MRRLSAAGKDVKVGDEAENKKERSTKWIIISPVLPSGR